jgi:hypothetical protein
MVESLWVERLAKLPYTCGGWIGSRKDRDFVEVEDSSL